MPNITQSPSSFLDTPGAKSVAYVGKRNAGPPETFLDSWVRIANLRGLGGIYHADYSFVTNINPNSLTLAQRDANRTALDQMCTDALALRATLTPYTTVLNTFVRVPVYLPPGVQIGFTPPWNVPSYVDIIAPNTVFRPLMDGATPGIVIGNVGDLNENMTMELGSIAPIAPRNYNWNQDSNVGIRVQGSRSGYFRLRNCIDFMIGVQAKPGPGMYIFDTDFWIPNFQNTVIGLDLRSSGGAGGGWINGNRFWGGGLQRVASAEGAPPSAQPMYGVRFSAVAGGYTQHNSNKFYGQEWQPGQIAPGTLWAATTVFAANSWVTHRNAATNEYRSYFTVAGGTSGTTPPTHLTGTVSDGGVSWVSVGPYAHSPVWTEIVGAGNQFLAQRWETGYGPFMIGQPQTGKWDFEVTQKSGVLNVRPWDIDIRAHVGDFSAQIIQPIRKINDPQRRETFHWPNPKDTAVMSAAGIIVPGWNDAPFAAGTAITNYNKINTVASINNNYIGTDGVHTNRVLAFILDLADGFSMFDLIRNWNGRFSATFYDASWNIFDASTMTLSPHARSDNMQLQGNLFKESADSTSDLRFVVDGTMVRYAAFSFGAGSGTPGLRDQHLITLQSNAEEINQQNLQPYMVWETSPVKLVPVDPHTRYSRGTPIECFLNAGEVIYELVPSVGGPNLWRCITGGALARPWETGQLVRVGTIRLSDTNKIYTATTTGTTGVIAPVGTGTGISDGAIFWDYHCPLATIVALT